MSDSEMTDENILSMIQAVMQMVSISLHESKSVPNTIQGMDPEYECLRAMMLEPQNPIMWNAMALVYMMTSQYEDARSSIEHSLDLDSGIAWTWSIWGDLLSLQKNDLESERAYRMAVELGSDDSHVYRRLIDCYVRRGNHHEALLLLEQLIPQYPEDQLLWDTYTQCYQRTHQFIHA